MSYLMNARFVWLLTLLLLFSGSVGSAVEKPTEAIDPENCTTSECHAEIMDYGVLHAPVNTKDCDACHLLTSAEEHVFELWRQDEDICTYCHKFDTGMLPVIHQPVITGECLGCHNPHGGRDRSFTREETMAETCGRCHESVAYGKSHLHTPVKKGECTTCHRPHAAKYPMLLDEAGTDLCFSCHDEFKDQLSYAQFVHEAMDEGCNTCHDTHGSDSPMSIIQPLPVLCLGCHEDIRQNTEGAVQHPPVTDERACMNCHTPHGGNLASLMCENPILACMNCHKEKTSEAGRELLTAMLRIGDPNRFHHAPVKEGDCGGCHAIHGGSEPLLLISDYSKEFYEPDASEDKQELCFECHDERLLEDERVTDASVTGFRNGDQNLHFVHVSEVDFGQNCRVCHGVHTSTFPQLIRDTVPYGEWQMSTRYIKTITGGTCMTGCHPELGYDRVSPVEATLTALPARPPQSVPAADKREPVMATLSVKDIKGRAVEVPAVDKASVLLFLRADQPQSRRVVELVSATPGVGAAQVLVFFCGDNANDVAMVFAETADKDWSIVADPQFRASGPLGVRAWPASLVVQADGVVAAHVGGAPPSLTLQLGAYLDLATEAIDRETLKDRLAETGLVGDGPGNRVVWHLQAGNRFLDERKAEEARGRFEEGLKLQPESAELQVGLVRALLETGEAKEASDVLSRLSETALPEWQKNVLQGRALAQLGQWDKARELAIGVLKEHPEAGAAHFLMGMIYEHEKQWELAAESYRIAFKEGAK